MQSIYFLIVLFCALSACAGSPGINDTPFMLPPQATPQQESHFTLPHCAVLRLERCERPGELRNLKIKERFIKKGALRVAIDQPLSAALGEGWSDPTNFYNWNFEGVEELYLKATTIAAARTILDNLRFLDALASVTLRVEKPTTHKQRQALSLDFWPDDKLLHLVFESRIPMTESPLQDNMTVINTSHMEDDRQRDKFIFEYWETLLDQASP